MQKTVCLKNNIIPDELWPKGTDPDEEPGYDFYDPHYSDHLHDLRMKYKNKKIKQIIIFALTFAYIIAYIGKHIKKHLLKTPHRRQRQVISIN